MKTPHKFKHAIREMAFGNEAVTVYCERCGHIAFDSQIGRLMDPKKAPDTCIEDTRRIERTDHTGLSPIGLCDATGAILWTQTVSESLQQGEEDQSPG